MRIDGGNFTDNKLIDARKWDVTQWLSHACNEDWVLKRDIPSAVEANSRLLVFMTPSGHELHVEARI